MSVTIDTLTGRVLALESQVAANVAVETQLKQKLDAALASANVLAGQIVQLQADLAAAQASGVDAAAVDALSGRVGAATQALSDSAAASSPAN